MPGWACPVRIHALITQFLAKAVSKLEFLATLCCHPFIELNFDGSTMPGHRATLRGPRYVGVDALSPKRCTKLVCPRKIFGAFRCNPFIEHGLGSICRRV
jgi:hypothetical protein